MAKNLKLKAARAEKDMTQGTLAEAVGVSRQTVNAIEKGEYNPTINLSGWSGRCCWLSCWWRDCSALPCGRWQAPGLCL